MYVCSELVTCRINSVLKMHFAWINVATRNQRTIEVDEVPGPFHSKSFCTLQSLTQPKWSKIESSNESLAFGAWYRTMENMTLVMNF